MCSCHFILIFHNFVVWQRSLEIRVRSEWVICRLWDHYSVRKCWVSYGFLRSCMKFTASMKENLVRKTITAMECRCIHWELYDLVVEYNRRISSTCVTQTSKSTLQIFSHPTFPPSCFSSKFIENNTSWRSLLCIDILHTNAARNCLVHLSSHKTKTSG